MGREIELKIKLTEEQYKIFFEQVITKAALPTATAPSSAFEQGAVKFYKGNTVLVTKTDENYSRYNTREERKANGEPNVIRIREESEGDLHRAYFTIKRKTFRDGTEINEENETAVEQPQVIRQLLEVAGYKCWFKKVKTAYSCYCEYADLEFHAELVKVNNLPYLEIEVTSEEEASEVVKEKLEKLIEELGFDLEKKDPRSWVEIAGE